MYKIASKKSSGLDVAGLMFMTEFVGRACDDEQRTREEAEATRLTGVPKRFFIGIFIIIIIDTLIEQTGLLAAPYVVLSTYSYILNRYR